MTIEEMWHQFEKEVLGGVSPDGVEGMKHVFYAGACACAVVVSEMRSVEDYRQVRKDLKAYLNSIMWMREPS